MPEFNDRNNATITGEDFFQGDVAVGLEKVRARLLDLSGKNRLLNFKYPTTPSRPILRIVDVLLDIVYRKLCDGQSLVFNYVPKPPQAPGAMLPFEDYANNPKVYLTGETQAGVATISPVTGRIKADEYARHKGISASFELPETDLAPEQNREEHRNRDYIQTLHYPGELERILRNIAKTSKTMVEETGVNTLYLIFGFLEWYEREDSDVPHLAPLVIVPVNIKKGAVDLQTGTNRYFIEYSGEEIDVNLTLRERLKQIVALPSFSDEDTPETYFDKLKPIIAQQPRWRVCRHITLATLSFHKFLMWQDLDHSRWPDGGLLQHPRIREFFIGTPFNGEFFSSDYQIDQPELQEDLPPLIYDSDSSQHSALIDALKGKNLVIEGPPGTGKSQTITNLIAAALAKGKTVLFVAEKQAALDVVQSRLVEANLGDFCLELHSNKAKTKSVAESLQRRLRLGNTLLRPAVLAQKKQAIEENKRRLIEYAETINSTYGGCDRTIQKTIWMREKLHSELRFDVSLIESILIEKAESLTIAQVEKLKQCAEIYGQHLSQALNGDRLNAHPWFGVTKQNLSFTEERALLNTLQTVFESANQIEHQITTLKNENGLLIQSGEPALEELIGLNGQLPVVNARLRKDLLRPLADMSFRSELRAFGDLLARYRTTRDEVSHHLGGLPDLSSDEIGMLRSSCAKTQQLGIATMPLAEIKRYSTWIESFSDYISRTLILFDQICHHLNCPLPFNAESVSVIVKALVLLEEAPLNALHYRNRLLEQDGIEPIISQSHQEAEKLHQQAAKLSSRIDWNLAPARDLLSQHAVVCANAGIFSFANKEFRLARRDWRGMSKRARKASGEQMALDYRSLIQYFDSLNTFTANRQYQEALGELFKGLKTPFAELLQLAKWYSLVRQRLGFGSESAMQITDALFSSPTVNLKALVELKRARETEFEQLQKVFGNFQSMVARLPNWLHKEAFAELNDLVIRLKDLSAHLNTIVLMFEEFRVETDLPMSSIPNLLDSLQRLTELKAEIQSNRKVASVIGVEVTSPEMNFEEVIETVTFAESLDGSSLPIEVKRWLLDENIEERIAKLREIISGLEADHHQFQQAREQFIALGAVNEKDWQFLQAPDSERGFKQVCSRAKQALESAPELSAWLRYQRARQGLVDAGLALLVRLAEEGRIPSDEVLPATLFIYQNSLLLGAFEKHPLLERFDGLAHDEIRKRFAELDKEIIKLTHAEIAWQISQREVPSGTHVGAISDLTDLGLIRRLISQSNPKIKIRRLMERAGKAIQALKPCFMMSPLSLSQFLPPGALNFDLIVMDEASQLRPEDALGAIARGSQIVVVGDRMQLPPTSFFDRLMRDEDESDEEEAAVDDSESILHLTSQIYQPKRMLKWHYRSRHESLIAFSNEKFYKDLIVFPAPSPLSEEIGVKFNFVSDGVYNNQQNRIEAERVVEAVIEHLINKPNESLGVVALNLKQSELIDELLGKRLKENELAKQRFEEWGKKGEEVFRKNLETVQGDERDVIFISINVALPTNRQFDLRSLGALNNKDYGHRRLNVLVTRARKRIVVFSSIDPDEINVEPSSSRGVRALKDYLAYAKTGVLEQPQETGREPDSEFEIVVADALRKRGFEITPQVGVASYRIDLAVRHPEKLGSYILGVECDGATYHSSRSARDRDRLRQAVLEGLGWNIHRIWSTDWFRNSEREIDKVVYRIKELLQKI